MYKILKELKVLENELVMIKPKIQDNISAACFINSIKAALALHWIKGLFIWERDNKRVGTINEICILPSFVCKLVVMFTWSWDVFHTTLAIQNPGIVGTTFLIYRDYLKERPGLNENPFEWAPLFTAEKINERPGLNERSLKPGKGRLIGNLQCLQRCSFR